MTSLPQTEWIQTQINDQINQFKSSRNHHRRLAFYMAVSSAILSALTTLFIGLSETVADNGFTIAALVTSATLNALTAIASIFSYREHWIRSNNTLMDLYELQSDFAYATMKTEHLPSDQLDSFYNRYTTLLKNSNKKWDEQRQSYES